MTAPRRLTVSFLFSRACPSHAEGLAVLTSAARDAGIDIDLTVVEVKSDEQAAELGFVGSPTYLVRDVDPFAPVGFDHGFRVDACRAYARPGGRIGPLPHRDDLMAALRADYDRDA